MVLRHRLHKHPFLEPSSNKFQSPVPSCSERRPSDVQRCPLPRNLKTISSRTNSLSHFAPGSTRPKKSKRIIVVLSHSNHTQLWMLESLVTCRSKPSGLQPGRKEIRGDRSKHWAREDMPNVLLSLRLLSLRLLIFTRQTERRSSILQIHFN